MAGISWSVHFNGIQYTQDNFEAYAYQDVDTGFPALARDIATHVANLHRGSAIDSLDLTLGSKFITTHKNKWLPPNTQIRLESAADSGVWLQGTVTDYNPATGALTFDCTAKSGTGSASDWLVEINFPNAYQEAERAKDEADRAAAASGAATKQVVFLGDWDAATGNAPPSPSTDIVTQYKASSSGQLGTGGLVVRTGDVFAYAGNDSWQMVARGKDYLDELESLAMAGL